MSRGGQTGPPNKTPSSSAPQPSQTPAGSQAAPPGASFLSAALAGAQQAGYAPLPANPQAARRTSLNYASCQPQEGAAPLVTTGQWRCYLCETPKQEYSLIRTFSEVVCRGCLNYEGPDQVERLIRQARKSKQPAASLAAQQGCWSLAAAAAAGFGPRPPPPPQPPGPLTARGPPVGITETIDLASSPPAPRSGPTRPLPVEPGVRRPSTGSAQPPPPSAPSSTKAANSPNSNSALQPRADIWSGRPRDQSEAPRAPVIGGSLKRKAADAAPGNQRARQEPAAKRTPASSPQPEASNPGEQVAPQGHKQPSQQASEAPGEQQQQQQQSCPAPRQQQVSQAKQAPGGQLGHLQPQLAAAHYAGSPLSLPLVAASMRRYAAPGELQSAAVAALNSRLEAEYEHFLLKEHAARAAGAHHQPPHHHAHLVQEHAAPAGERAASHYGSAACSLVGSYLPAMGHHSQLAAVAAAYGMPAAAALAANQGFQLANQHQLVAAEGSPSPHARNAFLAQGAGLLAVAAGDLLATTDTPHFYADPQTGAFLELEAAPVQGDSLKGPAAAKQPGGQQLYAPSSPCAAQLAPSGGALRMQTSAQSDHMTTCAHARAKRAQQAACCANKQQTLARCPFNAPAAPPAGAEPEVVLLDEQQSARPANLYCGPPVGSYHHHQQQQQQQQLAWLKQPPSSASGRAAAQPKPATPPGNRAAQESAAIEAQSAPRSQQQAGGQICVQGGRGASPPKRPAPLEQKEAALESRPKGSGNEQLKCLSCAEQLDDRHFVQCPTVQAHKFCFTCSKLSIQQQRLESARANGSESDKGEKCLLANEPHSWTFMNNEIETIFRESSRSTRQATTLQDLLEPEAGANSASSQPAIFAPGELRKPPAKQAQGHKANSRDEAAERGAASGDNGTLLKSSRKSAALTKQQRNAANREAQEKNALRISGAQNQLPSGGEQTQDKAELGKS